MTGRPVTPEHPSQSIAAARNAVRELHEARTRADAALDAQRDAVRAAYTANPELGPSALARAIGVTEGTLRGYTADLARARRRTGAGWTTGTRAKGARYGPAHE